MFPTHHLRLGFHSNFIARSNLPQGVRYHVMPPLPDGVWIDEEGSLVGSFVRQKERVEAKGYERGRVQYYTITAEDEKHREVFAISIDLRGGIESKMLRVESYDFDSDIVNNHVVYYNYYAKIPFFVLFTAFGIAGVVILMAVLEMVKLYRCSLCDYWTLFHSFLQPFSALLLDSAK